jgi:hypothetical protein
MIEETFPESTTIFMSNMTQAKASLTKMFRRKQQQLIYKLKAGRQIELFSKRNAVL